MLFDCKYYQKAFQNENCPLSSVCGELKCYFATKEMIEEYEDTIEELDYIKNENNDIESKINELENDNKQLEEEKEELEDEIKSLKNRIVQIVEYVNEKYDKDFKLEDV